MYCEMCGEETQSLYQWSDKLLCHRCYRICRAKLELLYIQILLCIGYTNEFRFSVSFECYENRCQN